MAVTEILPCSGTKHKGQNTDQVSREMAMEKKLMFVAFGYLLMLAALDASIAAMVVSGALHHLASGLLLLCCDCAPSVRFPLLNLGR